MTRTVEELERARDALDGKIVALARRLGRVRARLARARARAASVASTERLRALNVDPLLVECLTCDVGPGAACLFKAGRSKLPPSGLPFHGARIKLAEKRPGRGLS